MNFTCFVREPVLELVDHIYLRFNTHIRSCSYLRLQSLGLKDFKFKNKVTEREREKKILALRSFSLFTSAVASAMECTQQQPTCIQPTNLHLHNTYSLHTNIPIYVYNICIHIYAHLYGPTYIIIAHIHVQIQNIYTYIYIRIYTYKYIPIYTYIQSYTYAHANNTYTIHAYTHKHAHSMMGTALVRVESSRMVNAEGN